MIDISKEEAAIIRKKYPDACIVKTVHHQCVEESIRYLKLIPWNMEAAKLVAEYYKHHKEK